MTRDEAKALMSQHGWRDFDDVVELVLVAARLGADEEREGCAKVCEEIDAGQSHYADAIRARKW